jgi:membrane-associated phospholipid phosphatase
LQTLKDGDDSDYVAVATPLYKIVLLALKCIALFYLLGDGIYKTWKKNDPKFRPIIFLLAAEFLITIVLLVEELAFDNI